MIRYTRRWNWAASQLTALKRILEPRIWLVCTHNDTGTLVLGAYWRKKTAERKAVILGDPYNVCVGPVGLGHTPKRPIAYHLGYYPALAGEFSEVTFI